MTLDEILTLVFNAGYIHAMGKQNLTDTPIAEAKQAIREAIERARPDDLMLMTEQDKDVPRLVVAPNDLRSAILRELGLEP